MSHAADFYRRQLEYWQAQSRQASENADYAAFQAAEREAANYRAMLENVSATDIAQLGSLNTLP